jgi:hypothetical protein
MFGGKRKWWGTMVVNRNDTGTHWRGTILENRNGPWYPLEGHHGGEPEVTMEPTGGALYWRTERDRCTHWRGTMVVNRKTQLNPLEGNYSGE